MVTHRTTAQPKTTGPSTDAGHSASLEKSEKATTPKQPPELSTTEKNNHSTFWGPESRIDLELPGKDLKLVFSKSLIFYNDTWLKVSFYLKSVKDIS